MYIRELLTAEGVLMCTLGAVNCRGCINVYIRELLTTEGVLMSVWNCRGCVNVELFFLLRKLFLFSEAAQGLFSEAARKQLFC